MYFLLTVHYESLFHCVLVFSVFSRECSLFNIHCENMWVCGCLSRVGTGAACPDHSYSVSSSCSTSVPPSKPKCLKLPFYTSILSLRTSRNVLLMNPTNVATHRLCTVSSVMLQPLALTNVFGPQLGGFL